jgi:hypothetical protein
MSSDSTNKQGKNPGVIALLVGMVGLAVAGVGFIQGWQEDEVRPIMSWLIGIAFWLSVAGWDAFFNAKFGMCSTLVGRSWCAGSASTL